MNTQTWTYPLLQHWLRDTCAAAAALMALLASGSLSPLMPGTARSWPAHLSCGAARCIALHAWMHAVPPQRTAACMRSVSERVTGPERA